MVKDWSELTNYIKNERLGYLDINEIIDIMRDEYGFTLDKIQAQEESNYFEIGFGNYNSDTLQSVVIVGIGDLLHGWFIDHITYTYEEKYEDGSSSFTSDYIYGAARHITINME